MTTTSVFAEIIKTAPQSDGSLLVHGKATGSDLDLDQQQCDPTWLKKAMPEWFKIGNVRESHDAKRAVGKATEYEATEGGDHMITAKVIDPLAKAKIEAGILTGFSIGIKSPRIMKSATVKNGIITDGQIIEVSLVDRPALPTATLTICKSAEVGMEVDAADFDEARNLVKCEELTIQNEEAAKAAGDSEETKSPLKPKHPIMDEEDAEGEEKAVKPTPLDMPGAKPIQVNVTLDGKPIGEQVISEAAKSVEVNLDSSKIEEISREEINKAIDALTKALGQQRDEPIEKATDVEKLSDPAPGQKCADCGEDGHLNCKTIEIDESGDVEKSEVAETFDVESTKALVESILKGDGLGVDETSDISGADQAIRQIAQLIIAEAKEMADMPSEDCDIHLLMSAVDALRIFSNREKLEGQSINPDTVLMSAEPEKTKGSKYNAEQMAAMLKNGEAMANPKGDPSYPIADEADLSNAIRAVGRGSGDHDAIRRHIIKRAKALGKSDMIPDDWTNKAVEADEPIAPDVEKSLTGAFSEALNRALESVESVQSFVDAHPALNKFLTEFVTKGAEELLTKSADDFVKADSLEAIRGELDMIKKMATPGGPALRRTDAEVKTSRRQDLLRLAEMEERKAQAEGLHPTFRMGFQEKAAQLRAEANAL